MRVHRILISPLRPGTHDLHGEQAHYLRGVLRARPGAPVRAFDGSGLEADGVVTAIDGQRVEVALGEPAPGGREASVAVTVAVALLKGDKLSEVVRQGTELGVVRFRLFTSRYGDAPALSPRRLDRLRRVALEAARQAGRSVVPTVEAPVALADLGWQGAALLADPAAEPTLAQALAGQAPAALTLITGPEGGFEEAEVARLVAAGATAVRLGSRILRAETAPVALAAAVLLPEAL